MSTKYHRGVTLAAAGLVFVAASAQAGPAFTERRMQLGGGLSYGLYLGDYADEIPTPYGLGAHVRAGYTLHPAVYLGAELNYFFGASQRFPDYGDVALSILHVGGEAGYDIGIGVWCVLRPKIGVGAARAVADLTVEGIHGFVSETGLAWTAGAQALVGSGAWFAALEARYTSLSIDTEPLQDIPGLEIEDDTQLDGLLLSVGGGVSF